MANQPVIVKSNEAVLDIKLATPRFLYSKDYEAQRSFSGCRGHLNDTLYHAYHSNTYDGNWQLLLAFANSKQRNMFLNNIAWFNDWQTFLGFTPCEIISTNTTLEGRHRTKLSNLTLVSFDKRWFTMGLLQNTFLTFIIKCMMYHQFNKTINFDSLYADVTWQEQEYLDVIEKKGFLFYLNWIHKITVPEPWGIRQEDFWTHHHSHGFVNNFDKIRKEYNIHNLSILEQAQ